MSALCKDHPLVREVGGKHASLMVVQDAGFGNNVVSFEITPCATDFTEAQISKIRNQLEVWNASEVIMRTSHQGDWMGLTDAMPTMRCLVNEIPQTLAAIRQRLCDPRLKCFADNEREWFQTFDIPFKPEQCTVSIAPYLGDDYSVITEHPNKPGEILLDNFEDGSWFLEESPWEGDPYLVLQKNLRSSQIFQADDAIQIEAGLHEGISMFYQARQFATNDFSPDNSCSGFRSRIFGNTSRKPNEEEMAQMLKSDPCLTREDLEFYFEEDPVRTTLLDINNLNNRQSYVGGLTSWEVYERRNPGKFYAMVNTMWSSRMPSPDFTQQQWMNFYFGRNRALRHHHTRAIQYCLRRKGGAVLGDYLAILNSLDGFFGSSNHPVYAFLAPHNFQIWNQ